MLLIISNNYDHSVMIIVVFEGICTFFFLLMGYLDGALVGESIGSDSSSKMIS